MPAEWQQTNARRKALFRPWNLGLSMKRSRFDNKYVRLYENIVHRVGNRPVRCMGKSIREEMKKRKHKLVSINKEKELRMKNYD